MRDYGKVFATFWTSDTTSGLSDDGKLLALYLITSPHTNALGCFRLTDGYVTDDMGWDRQRVTKGFEELFRKGFSNRCETTGWVLIRKHLSWNRPENPNQVKAIARLALQIPAHFEFRAEVKAALDQYVETEDADAKKALADAKRRLGSETLSEPFRNQKQEQKQEQEQKQDVSARDKPAPTTPVWEAYSEAYQIRYAQAPIRNAKVNGILARFCKLLPADEAPQVAAFYLRHPSALYGQSGHCVELMLRDAEKLRMEWANGQTINAHQARQQERTAANPFAQIAVEQRRQEALTRVK